MGKLSLNKKLLHIWLCIHFAILLFSYSSYDLFNNYSNYEVKNFWPFVEYARYKNKFIPTRQLGAEMGYGTEGYESKEKEMTAFMGIFNDYDYTEFLAYSIFGIIIFLLTKKRNDLPNAKEGEGVVANNSAESEQIINENVGNNNSNVFQS